MNEDLSKKIDGFLATLSDHQLATLSDIVDQYENTAEIMLELELQRRAKAHTAKRAEESDDSAVAAYVAAGLGEEC